MSAAVSEAHVRTFIESLDLYAKHGGTLISQNDADMLADDLRLILSERQEGSGALPASPSGGQWQPIETAPRDGTEFLAFRSDQGVFVCRFAWLGEFVSDSDTTPYDENFSGWFSDLSGWLENELTPTHWMPLPDAPQTGMEPKAECAQPSRSDVLERIRAFDARAHYGEPEYERLADDLEALAQPNQPRDREEG